MFALNKLVFPVLNELTFRFSVPRKDHAVVMARFARDCSNTFSSLVKTMEMQLGPDTAGTLLRLNLFCFKGF